MYSIITIIVIIYCKNYNPNVPWAYFTIIFKLVDTWDWNLIILSCDHYYLYSYKDKSVRILFSLKNHEK